MKIHEASFQLSSLFFFWICLQENTIPFFNGKYENFIHLKLNYNRETKHENYKLRSSIRRCSIRLGKDIFQTCETPEFLATFASSWATLLPSLFRRLKEHQENKASTSLMFLIICPSSPPWIPPLIAWIMDKASDSKIAWETSISLARSTPSCMVRASEILAEYDADRTLLEAVSTTPMLSRMATPMHDFLLSSKAAASVLILKKPVGGAFHLGKGMEWDNIG